jgi:transposase
MPRPACRFIKKLTKRQTQKLEELKDHGGTPRIRHRAHAILLSLDGTSVVELARIFQTSRTTISQWLDRWDVEGLDGLADKPRPGSPTKLTESEQAQALELLKESPHNPAGVLSEIKQKTGKEISRSTLKRLARKANMIWKRARKSLKGKRDQKKFATQA